ncbi:MAG TPA: hypothetical protein VGS14_04605 [Actinomycetes bacterium]|nr:hypothetical protein [Actinomycetes bacterium]
MEPSAARWLRQGPAPLSVPASSCYEPRRSRRAVEADLGMTAPARHHLAEAFEINPYLTVRDRPAALALAGRLHLPAPGRTSGR